MQCHLRSAPNFSPARQHAVNPLVPRVSHRAGAASPFPLLLPSTIPCLSAEWLLQGHIEGPCWSTGCLDPEDAQTRGKGSHPGDSPARGSGAPRLPMSSVALQVRWPRARGCAGRTRLRARAPISARAARPRVRGSPTREGREPPRAAQSGFRARCLDAVAVAARAGGFPRAPAPSQPAPLLPPCSHTQNSLSAAPRVPTQSAVGSQRAGTCLQKPQPCGRAHRLGGKGRCRKGCLSERSAFQVAMSSIILPGILASLVYQACFPPK